MAKKIALLTILLTLVSMPSLAADQWLCIGEKMSTIFMNDQLEFESMALDSDEKFVVSEDGLKFLGNDEYHFNAEDCALESDGDLACASNLTRLGFFHMTTFAGVAVFYRYQIIFLELFNAYHTQVMGRCSKISD